MAPTKLSRYAAKKLAQLDNIPDAYSFDISPPVVMPTTNHPSAQSGLRRLKPEPNHAKVLQRKRLSDLSFADLSRGLRSSRRTFDEMPVQIINMVHDAPFSYHSRPFTGSTARPSTVSGSSQNRPIALRRLREHPLLENSDLLQAVKRPNIRTIPWQSTFEQGRKTSQVTSGRPSITAANAPCTTELPSILKKTGKHPKEKTLSLKTTQCDECQVKPRTGKHIVPAFKFPEQLPYQKEYLPDTTKKCAAGQIGTGTSGITNASRKSKAQNNQQTRLQKENLPRLKTAECTECQEPWASKVLGESPKSKTLKPRQIYPQEENEPVTTTEYKEFQVRPGHSKNMGSTPKPKSQNSRQMHTKVENLPATTTEYKECPVQPENSKIMDTTSKVSAQTPWQLNRKEKDQPNSTKEFKECTEYQVKTGSDKILGGAPKPVIQRIKHETHHKKILPVTTTECSEYTESQARLRPSNTMAPASKNIIHSIWEVPHEKEKLTAKTPDKISHAQIHRLKPQDQAEVSEESLHVVSPKPSRYVEKVGDTEIIVQVPAIITNTTQKQRETMS